MTTAAGFPNRPHSCLAAALVAVLCCVCAGPAGAASHEGHGVGHDQHSHDQHGQDHHSQGHHGQSPAAPATPEELVETDLAQAPVSIRNASIRLPLPGQTSAVVYLSVHNLTGHELVLVAAEVQGSARAELHQHLHEDGMMRMRQVKRIVVPVGQALELAPGGYHIMVYELAAAPADASLQRAFPVTLKFESGEQVTANAWPVP